jgi:hypothetical protein
MYSIPVLEVSERMSGGQTARWAVYQDVNEERPEETMAAGRVTPTRSHWRGGVADSWRPEESRKAGDDREERGSWHAETRSPRTSSLRPRGWRRRA